MPTSELPEPLAVSLQILELSTVLKEGSAGEGDLPATVRGIFSRFDLEKIHWVLVGAGAINFYSRRPRATQDVDLIVEAAHLSRAASIAQTVMGRGTRRENRGTHVTLHSPVSPLIVDLIRSDQHALFQTALKEKRRRKGVRIPPLEVILALKYLSAVSPYRHVDDKRQDLVDFARVLRANGERVNKGRLIDLGAQAHERARAEIARLIDDIEHDRPITL